MHLTAFRSGKGDCLVLENSKRTARILVDGGMPDSYSSYVAPALGKLRSQDKKIDVVYVSHIDQDHIGGILRMLDDEADWRIHLFKKKKKVTSGNKEPVAPRPAEIKAIWHNAFHEQLEDNAGAIEEALAASAPLLSGAELMEMREVGLTQSQLVASVNEAIRVSRRIGKGQLGIPLNPQARGKLMMWRKGQKPFTLGGMRITTLGPTEDSLEKLREEWNTWLKNNRKALKALRERAARDEKSLVASDLSRLMLALSLRTEAFGDPKSVTPPNLASLTLLAEEDGESILLTGDARGDQLLDGLRAAGRLAKGGILRVNILKVQHHGSKNNIDPVFCQTVIATDYVFCGNGEQHGNPHPDVVELIADQREAVEASGFRFWFNSSEGVEEKKAPAAHMAKIEKLVRGLAKKSKGRLKFKFLKSGTSLEIS